MGTYGFDRNSYVDFSVKEVLLPILRNLTQVFKMMYKLKSTLIGVGLWHIATINLIMHSFRKALFHVPLSTVRDSKGYNLLNSGTETVECHSRGILLDFLSAAIAPLGKCDALLQNSSHYLGICLSFPAVSDLGPLHRNNLLLIFKQ